MTEVNTTTSSPLVDAIGKIKESALHVFSQVRPPPSSSLHHHSGISVAALYSIRASRFEVVPTRNEHDYVI